MITNYGFQGEEAVDLSDVIKLFTVKRAFEGPQLLIAWEFFDEIAVDQLKIMKKKGAYPLNVNDGIEIVDDTGGGNYIDLSVNGGEIYYYTMLIKKAGDPSFVFDTVGMGKEMALTTGYYPHKLLELLPELYTARDANKKTLIIGEI